MDKIFAVSFIAMLAVSAANAKVVTQTNIVGGNGISVSVPVSGDNAGKVEVSNSIAPASGTSNTAAGTATKEVSIPSITDLQPGQIIVVTPSATTTVGEEKIKLNNGTAYPILRNGVATTTTTGPYVWTKDRPAVFVFDGSHWVFIGGYDYNTNTTYSSMTVAEIEAGTGTTARIITPARLKTAIQTWAPAESIATDSTTGVVKGGGNVDIANDGTLSVDLSGKANATHTHNTSEVTALTSYAKGSSSAALATTDTLNQALGKLEKKADDAAAAAASAASSVTASGSNGVSASASNGAITVTGVDASTDAKGVIEIATDTEANTGTDTTRAVTPKQLATKVKIAQGSGAANKAVITNSSGNITTGTISSAMITDGTIANADVASGAAITTNKMGAITGYEKASTNADLAATDTLNTALGKLEKKADDAAAAAASAASSVTASGSNGVTASASNGAISVSGTNATKDAKGVVQVGDNISVTDGTISVPAANGSTSLGVVKAGTNVSISSAGVVSVASASTSAKGLIEIATDTEASTGTDTSRAVTPKQLKTAAGTAETNAKAYADGLASNYAASSHNHASSDVNAMTGYAKADSAAAIATSDTLNQAIGKLEKGLDTKANTGDLATVATSGSYNDLSNKPTIPTVNNATLTIQKNGTTVKTFTANASSNVTANITVPTQPSDIGAAAASHNHASSDVNAMTGYAKAGTAAAIATSDTLNQAIGKLEKALDGKQASGDYAAASHTHATNEVTALTGYSKGTASSALATGDTLNQALSKLENQVDKKLTTAQGSGAANKAVITNSSGNITTGTISSAMITDSTITNADIASNAAIAVSKISGAQTTANMVTSTSDYNDDIANANKYPNMPVVNQMIGDSQVALTSRVGALESGKIDKTVAADANAVMVRGTGGTYVKGTGTDVSVANDGAITVNHATSANSIPSGSENATTYATIWVE